MNKKQEKIKITNTKKSDRKSRRKNSNESTRNSGRQRGGNGPIQTTI